MATPDDADDRPLSRSEILLHSHELALALGRNEDDIQAEIAQGAPSGRRQREIVWRLYTDAFLDAYDDEAAAQALYSLGLLLDDEQRDPRLLLRMSARAYVAHHVAKAGGRDLVFQLRASNSSCSACARASGRYVAASDAARAPHIPNPHCTRRLNGAVPFCRCRYVAVSASAPTPRKRAARPTAPSPRIEGATHKPGRTRSSLLGDVQSG